MTDQKNCEFYDIWFHLNFDEQSNYYIHLMSAILQLKFL